MVSAAKNRAIVGRAALLIGLLAASGAARGAHREPAGPGEPARLELPDTPSFGEGARRAQLKAAQRAVQYGAMAFGESGSFEGLRPLDNTERDRLLRVLGAYLGRTLQASGAFESTAPRPSDTVTTQWMMAKFLRDQRKAFHLLMTQGTTLLDTPREGTWRYRLVDHIGDLVGFRLANLRFLETIRPMARDDHGLRKTAAQLERYLHDMDVKTQEIQKPLTLLAER